eukprot:GHVL01011606.1.p1 GENE.GHVL01011606.1~~GHVL01011606.1.p1  ORF type:complete len:165 (-),score=17.71 GHVL01011606.1:178-672(-)
MPVVIEQETSHHEIRVDDRKRMFSKTKMCPFYPDRCFRGQDCNFAHQSLELNHQPNLHKTSLCRKYQLGKCSDPNCRYAHGEVELRRTSVENTLPASSKFCDFREKPVPSGLWVPLPSLLDEPNTQFSFTMGAVAFRCVSEFFKYLRSIPVTDITMSMPQSYSE